MKDVEADQIFRFVFADRDVLRLVQELAVGCFINGQGEAVCNMYKSPAAKTLSMFPTDTGIHQLTFVHVQPHLVFGIGGPPLVRAGKRF